MGGKEILIQLYFRYRYIVYLIMLYNQNTDNVMSRMQMYEFPNLLIYDKNTVSF